MGKRIFILFVVCMFCCIGCGKTDNYITEEYTGEIQEEKEKDIMLATKEDFIEQYGLSEDEASRYDIEGFIEEYYISKEDLATAHYDIYLKADAEAGVEYGYNVQRYILRDYRKAELEDDYSKALYFIFTTESVVDDGVMKINSVVIDLQKKLIYYNCDLTDLRTAEITKEITQTEIEEIADILDSMCMPEWKDNLSYGYDGNEYNWRISIIMTKRDVIRCEGNVPWFKTEYEDIFAQLMEYTEKIKIENINNSGEIEQQK